MEKNITLEPPIDASQAFEVVIAVIGKLERRQDALEKIVALQQRGMGMLGTALRTQSEMCWACIRLLNEFLSKPEDERLAADFQRGLAEVRELEKLFGAQNPPEPPTQP